MFSHSEFTRTFELSTENIKGQGGIDCGGIDCVALVYNQIFNTLTLLFRVARALVHCCCCNRPTKSNWKSALPRYKWQNKPNFPIHPFEDVVSCGYFCGTWCFLCVGGGGVGRSSTHSVDNDGLMCSDNVGNHCEPICKIRDPVTNLLLTKSYPIWNRLKYLQPPGD